MSSSQLECLSSHTETLLSALVTDTKGQVLSHVRRAKAGELVSPVFDMARIALPTLSQMHEQRGSVMVQWVPVESGIPLGWLRLFAEEAGFATALAKAEQARAEYGVGFRALDAAGLAAAEPHLQITRPHALHWTDPLSVSDPHALVLAYAALLAREGGRFVRGDAMTLARHGPGWRVATEAGPLAAEEVVVALGAHAAALTRRFGYAPPLFGKRGYHKHYAMLGNAVLHHPVIDTPAGFALMPMRAGVRLTTGIEFAALDAPATPVQLTRAEPVARAMLPLGEAREATPWMGVRPCLPDMLPVIGPLPGMPGAWGAFGHAHQGFTLGPSTGRLLAEMMAGEAPFVPPGPYRAERF